MGLIRKSIALSVCVAVLVSSGLMAPHHSASAFPIDASVEGCWKRDVRYWFTQYSTFPAETELAIDLAFSIWEVVRKPNGNRHIVVSNQGGSQPPAGNYARVKVAINAIWPPGDGALGSCFDALPFVTEEGAILIHPDNVDDSIESEIRLYKHEIGHVLGLGHTGDNDNWYDAAIPWMIPGCGLGSQRSSDFTGDDLAALDYNQFTKSGDIKDEEWTSPDAGFENHATEVRKTKNASLSYLTGSLAYKGNDYAQLNPLASYGHVRVGVRLANQSDEGHGPHVLEAQGRVRAIQTPATGVGRMSIYQRAVTYNPHSCTSRFPLEGGSGADVDSSRSYYNPSVAASASSDPTSSGSNYVRRSFQQKGAGSFGASWTFLQTSEITANAYVNDWIALFESNLRMSTGALVQLRVDQFGLRVTEN